ncbi:Ig-like domain-containing protein, partial [Cribrihabitans sp. XS_ASV171]
TTLPEIFTHEDLPVLVKLDEIADDQEGDPVFFRIVDSENVTARFTPDGQYLRITPSDGFTGAASITVAADDGYAQTRDITLDVTVSDAELTSITLLQREYYFTEAGEVGDLVVVGQFADQADVILPFDYVNVATPDPDIIKIGSNGLVTALKEGDTHILAHRDNLSAATAVAVGIADDPNGAVAQIFGIDAYPDSVTIVPDGGQRQIVTELGTLGTDFVQGTEDGVVYVSSDTDIVTVTDDGLIEAVATGETTVTVIYRGAEEVLTVTVAPPVEAASTEMDEAGGAMRTPDGIEIAVGAGQLSGTATISAEARSEAELDLEVPPDFDFVAGGVIDIQGGALNGPIQLATKVSGDVAQEGDEVLF